MSTHRSLSTATAIFIAAVLVSRPLAAHERSESYSHWRFANGELRGVLTVRTREVTRLMLPGEGYGPLAQLYAVHAGKFVTARIDGQACVPTHPARPLEAEPGYSRVEVDLRCPRGASLAVSVDTFFDVAPSHDHFIYVETATGNAREAILTVASREVRLEVDPTGRSGSPMLQFVRTGILHIASGFDHLAFLLALLVTARTARQMLLAVTGFTLGHSVTLALAVFGWMHADRGAVEPLIGMTIALAAAANLLTDHGERGWDGVLTASITLLLLGVPAAARPSMPGMLVAPLALAAACFVWLNGARAGGRDGIDRFWMATCFGMVHGLGFAGALLDMQLPPNRLLSALFGFNVGVELGQLAAVAGAVLLARLAVRLWPAVSRHEMPAVLTNAALLALGTAWFFSRSVPTDLP